MYYKNGSRKKRINRTKPAQAETNRCSRGTPIAFASVKNRETKKIPVPEHVVDFMKGMNPQQLVDFLCPNDDDWHVKTSSVNASGN